MVPWLSASPNWSGLRLCQFSFHCMLSPLDPRKAKTQALTQILNFPFFRQSFSWHYSPTYDAMFLLNIVYMILKNCILKKKILRDYGKKKIWLGQTTKDSQGFLTRISQNRRIPPKTGAQPSLPGPGCSVTVAHPMWLSSLLGEEALEDSLF